MNNPVLAMVFLQPNYRPRFRFNLAGIEKSLGPTIRTVRFEEFRVPTILRTGANQDLLSRGLIWVDEQTGRVVKTRLQVGAAGESRRRLSPPIATSPSSGSTCRPRCGTGIPTATAATSKGVATYGRFRRFQVQTEESIQK